jgi:hypothetical protein
MTAAPLRSLVGTLLLWAGLIVLAMALADSMHSLPWAMPRLWYLTRPLCLGLATLSAITGAKLLWGTTDRPRHRDEDEDSDDDDDDDVDDDDDDSDQPEDAR